MVTGLLAKRGPSLVTGRDRTSTPCAGVTWPTMVRRARAPRRRFASAGIGRRPQPGRLGTPICSVGFMTPRRSWLETSTDVVVDELACFGLVASRAQVSEVIRQRVVTVASALGITEQSARRYLLEENLRELARGVAVTLADEQPGADLPEQPRTVPMSLQIFGRTVAALAEAAHLRERNADAVGVHGALQMISFFAQRLHELPVASSGPVFLPRAALTRTARLLDATAQMIRGGAPMAPEIPADDRPAFAEAFARDATTLHSLLDEHG
jgi:hypothetical protein